MSWTLYADSDYGLQYGSTPPKTLVGTSKEMYGISFNIDKAYPKGRYLRLPRLIKRLEVKVRALIRVCLTDIRIEDCEAATLVIPVSALESPNIPGKVGNMRKTSTHKSVAPRHPLRRLPM